MAVAVYAVGAALLAVWLDARCSTPSIGRAVAHAAAAFVVISLLPPALHALAVEEGTSLRVTASLVLLVLPAFVYAFFALCRLMRSIAPLLHLR
jgi:hypothetical protein